MSEKPVNLNRFRKDRARAEKKARADQNAAFHGLTKAEKARAKAEAAREAQAHEQTRRDED
ncbi:DUF4169 family protein [Vannielia litorea]|uniref:DUF4169 family protein n=1 Tax=Vannielia litorea TaxID=1217970 RepID=UPI001BCEEE79|nr:DUF4169 family protein [Vannielia litorea]MBS8228148.1 DUF4169 family protein [Vannielia litorea]